MQVPRIQSTVREAGLPDTRIQGNAPLEAFGGGQAIANVGRAASDLTKIIVEEKVKADDARVTDYQNKLKAYKQQLLFAPPSREGKGGGALSRQGSDSFNAEQEFGEMFDKYASELEKDLSGRQKALAAQYRQQERGDLNQNIMKHVSSESQKYQDQTVKAGIEVAKNEASLFFDQPEKIQAALNQTKELYFKTAAGKPPALVQQELSNHIGDVHRSVMERMVENGRELEAKDYFEKNKADLGQYVDESEKLISEGVRRKSAQQATDKIVFETKSLGAALEEAKKIEDGKLRDDVVNRVKDHYSMKKLAETQMEEDRFKRADQLLAQGGDVDKLPRSLWNQFTLSEQNKLRDIARQKREGSASTDWNEYYNLKTMASAPQLRGEFKTMNLMQYRDKLGDSEFKELVNLQTQLRSGNAEADKILDGYRTNSEIVNSALSEAGIDPSPKEGSDDAKQVNLFRRKVDERVVAFQMQTGKKVTTTDMQKIVDEMMVEGITKKGWIWDTRKKKFQLEPGEKLEFDINDVPEAEKAKIEQALKMRKIPVTNERIVELYSRKISGK